MEFLVEVWNYLNIEFTTLEVECKEFPNINWNLYLNCNLVYINYNPRLLSNLAL